MQIVQGFESVKLITSLSVKYITKCLYLKRVSKTIRLSLQEKVKGTFLSLSKPFSMNCLMFLRTLLNMYLHAEPVILESRSKKLLARPIALGGVL